MVEGLVSTVIPVHNRAALLREAVASVVAQTFRPVEMIIVDDGSTDDTSLVAEELANRHADLIRVVHQSNEGPGGAREAGRRLARGEFIQYLDSDDVLLPRKFELQVAGLRAYPEKGVAYGKTHHSRHGTVPDDVPWKMTGRKMDYLFPAFLKERGWSTVTPLFRRTVTDLVGPWSNLRQCEDWEYDCRVAALGVRVLYVDAFVAVVRMHDGPALSDAWAGSDRALRDRARAYELIWQHAQRAGLDWNCPEGHHFAREAFLVSRQCATRGLPEEAARLFALARTASASTRARGFDLMAYRCAAAVVGWQGAGRLAQARDRIVSSLRGVGRRGR
jgi:glycosyltransferase involved in cell wall biosynthesis